MGRQKSKAIQENQRTSTISGIFKEIASRFPNQIAIRAGHDSITYRELDQTSRRIAGHLIKNIGDEPSPVALLLKDSRAIISCLLGIIRSGHFYTALSLKDSLSRLQEVLLDLHPRLLITDHTFLRYAKEILPADCKILLYPETQGFPEEECLPIAGPKSLLGIFYTSGSTGVPKGVLRTHDYVLHRIRVDVEDYGIGPGDKLLYMKQFNVSSSLSSIFDALLSGATLVHYDFDTLGIGSLVDILISEKITIFTPPIELMRQFLDNLGEETKFPAIRCAILAGDVLYRRDVERMRVHLPDRAVIIHHLSSSESGLLARSILNQDTSIDSDIVPLGFPVPGKEVLILDPETGNKVDRGKAGEIAVRSDVIFPGYWQEPDQTEDKFSMDPEFPSKQVFRTGDLGYFRPDGQLIFLGRKDFRVKIRGFSVDLASIECTLMTHDEISRAVVTSQVDPRGKKRLIAYVVYKPGSNLATSTLRDFLKKKLPEYMVPSIFQVLEEMPYTATFKVDRKTLPSPDWSQLKTQELFVAPQDEIEKKMAVIWQRVTGVKTIGIDDHFFDIGGDSLMVMELILQLAKEFDIHIPARLLTEHDTIRDLATYIREPELIHQDMIVELSLTGTGSPVFLIPGGNGEIYSILHLAKLLEGRQPIYGLQAAGEGGKHLYKQTVEEIATQFLNEILKIQSRGPYRLIGGSFGGVVAFEIAQMLHKRGEKIELLGMIDTLPPGPRQKAKLTTRIKLHWENIRSTPINKLPIYLNNWWKIFLIGLARKKIFRKIFSFNRLDNAIKGTEVIRAGRTAYALYDPKPFPGDMVLFKAKQRPWYVDWEPTEAWNKYFLGNIKVVEVEGTHGLVYKPPYVAGLAEAILKYL